MDPCARIADLCACAGWRAVLEAGRAHRTAHRLRDRLVSLAVEILAGAEALDRSVDDARVDLANALPREALAIQYARPEVLDHDIGALNQFGQDLPALLGLEVEREAPLVAVEHREVEAVDARDVAELGARRPGRRQPLLHDAQLQ